MLLRKVNNLLFKNCRGSYSSRYKLMSTISNAKYLLYKEYGEPADVLQLSTGSLNAPGENYVRKNKF